MNNDFNEIQVMDGANGECGNSWLNLYCKGVIVSHSQVCDYRLDDQYCRLYKCCSRVHQTVSGAAITAITARVTCRFNDNSLTLDAFGTIRLLYRQMQLILQVYWRRSIIFEVLLSAVGDVGTYYRIRSIVCRQEMRFSTSCVRQK